MGKSFWIGRETSGYYIDRIKNYTCKIDSLGSINFEFITGIKLGEGEKEKFKLMRVKK